MNNSVQGLSESNVIENKIKPFYFGNDLCLFQYLTQVFIVQRNAFIETWKPLMINNKDVASPTSAL